MVDADYNIWVTYHKDELAARYDLFNGARVHPFPTHQNSWPEVNVNHLNPAWSEMVAMWAVWQKRNGLRSDYVGFNHYRRRFDVSRMPAPGECQVLSILDFGMESVYGQFARCHGPADMDIALRILEAKYGKDNPYSRQITRSNKMVYACCFLMAWDDFDKLCRFLFDFIDAFSEAVGCGADLTKWRNRAARIWGEAKADYQMRTISFLAERMISAWILTHLHTYEQRDIAIVHFNTPELTRATIASIRKNNPECNITIFDNSDRLPFGEMDGVQVLDNTHGELIDLDGLLDQYPNKVPSVNNWGSARHIWSIDWLWDIFPNDFLLMDSDVLVKRSLSPFFKRFPATIAWAGEIHWLPTNQTTTRLLPYCLWMNVRECKAHGIRFFAEDRADKLVPGPPWHDTGASFWEDCEAAGLKGHQLPLNDYIEHLAMGSFKKTPEATREWLQKHKNLWSI